MGPALPKTLGIQISQTIDTLMVGREQHLVLGESTSVVTGSIKFSSQVGYGKDLYGYDTPLPQTDLEKFLGVVPARTSFDVFESSTGGVGRRQLRGGGGVSSSSPYGLTTISNTQTTNNYLDLTANTTIVKLKIGYDGLLNGSTTTITLPTVGLITYLNIPSVNGTVHWFEQLFLRGPFKLLGETLFSGHLSWEYYNRHILYLSQLHRYTSVPGLGEPTLSVRKISRMCGGAV